MATERIRLTNNSFVTKDSIGNTTFDSNNLYLKSDSTGVVNVGGYSRCAVAAGLVDTNKNLISDKSYMGGFPVYYSKVGQPYVNTSGTFTPITEYSPYFAIPRFSKLECSYLDDQFYWFDGSSYTTYITNPITIYHSNGITLGTVRFVKRGSYGWWSKDFGTSSTLYSSRYQGTLAEKLTYYYDSTTYYPTGYLSFYFTSIYWYYWDGATISSTPSSGPFSYIQYDTGGSMFSVIENPTQLSLAVTP